MLADHSRSQIQKLIADGHVAVRAVRQAPAAAPSRTSSCTRATASRVDVPGASRRRQVRGEALPLEILYQDADLAVLNKPAGMVVHPGAATPPARWSTRCCITWPI